MCVSVFKLRQLERSGSRIGRRRDQGSQCLPFVLCPGVSAIDIGSKDRNANRYSTGHQISPLAAYSGTAHQVRIIRGKGVGTNGR
jgi:hypothetical protein